MDDLLKQIDQLIRDHVEKQTDISFSRGFDRGVNIGFKSGMQRAKYEAGLPTEDKL